jgi:hypothetical protein
MSLFSDFDHIVKKQQHTHETEHQQNSNNNKTSTPTPKQTITNFYQFEAGHCCS